jgi:hypothetical protein
MNILLDLQKALPHPRLSVYTAYYKQNNYVLNLGIHNSQNDNISVYVLGGNYAILRFSRSGI